MRRKSQPTRGAQSIAATVGRVGAAVPGSTGEIASEVSAGVAAGAAVAGPLALAVSTAAPDAERPGRRLLRHNGAHAAAHGVTHAGSHLGGHARHADGWHHDAVGLTPPAAPVYLVPDTPDDAGIRAPLAARALKRAVDLAGALVGLLLTAPLLAVLAVLVRLGSPGPVFFAQARVGRGGRVFRCYKLRTMRHDAESLLRTDPELRATYERHGFKIPCDADHRVTPVGRLLRLSSCDELPQLWNVLKGEMSLVGPRPLVVRELGHYPGTDRDVLLSVRPGLTGAWAVGGRSRVGYPERARMELEYVREWSIGGDALILLKTIGAVLARRGAA